MLLCTNSDLPLVLFFFFKYRTCNYKKINKNHDLWSCSCIILCRICLQCIGAFMFRWASRCWSRGTNEKKNWYVRACCKPSAIIFRRISYNTARDKSLRAAILQREKKIVFLRNPCKHILYAIICNCYYLQMYELRP